MKCKCFNYQIDIYSEGTKFLWCFQWFHPPIQKMLNGSMVMDTIIRIEWKFNSYLRLILLLSEALTTATFCSYARSIRFYIFIWNSCSYVFHPKYWIKYKKTGSWSMAFPWQNADLNIHAMFDMKWSSRDGWNKWCGWNHRKLVFIFTILDISLLRTVWDCPPHRILHGHSSKKSNKKLLQISEQGKLFLLLKHLIIWSVYNHFFRNI